MVIYNNIIPKIIIILLYLLVISCSKDRNNSINKVFLEKYSHILEGKKKQIIQYNKKTTHKQSFREVHFFEAPTISNLDKYKNYRKDAKIFFVNYLSHNFPEQYPILDVNFDDINIPQKDGFNVVTKLDKSYPLVDKVILKKNINYISNNRNYELINKIKENLE